MIVVVGSAVEDKFKSVYSSCYFKQEVMWIYISQIRYLLSSNQSLSKVLFFFICHIYPTFTRKQIVLLYFERDVCTRFGVAISALSGPPVFDIKVGVSH